MSGKPRQPKTLYHYTSTDTFKAIISSGIMRASRYDQMNDHGEFQFGVEKLLESLDAREVPTEDREYFEFLRAGVEELRKSSHEVYLVSFSAAINSLDQWRAYCPDGGVAIGFDTARTAFLRDVTGHFPDEFIKNEPIRKDPSVALGKCIYSDKHGKFRKLKELSDSLFKENSFSTMFQVADQHPFADQIFMSSLAAWLFSKIPLIKHGAYRSENEWRFVNRHPNERDYPVKRSNTNRRYIELKFRPEACVSKVWISPHGDTQATEKAAEFLKQQLGLSYEIEVSTIPFRTGQ